MTLETVGVVRGGSQPRRTVGGPFPHGPMQSERHNSPKGTIVRKAQQSERTVRKAQQSAQTARVVWRRSLSIALKLHNTAATTTSLQSTNFCTLQSGGYYTRTRIADRATPHKLEKMPKAAHVVGVGRGQKPTLL